MRHILRASQTPHTRRKRPDITLTDFTSQHATTTRTDAQNKSRHHVRRAVLSPPRLPA
nr:MAG TPA: hypothetical protein [Caudoviricetes sp.]